MNKKVCVVVPVFNHLEETKRFIIDFKNNTYSNYTIVIVNDASKDGTSDYLKTNFPEVVVVEGNGDLWWSGGTNEGVKYAMQKGFDYVLTINNDSETDKNMLSNLINCAGENPESIIGARVMLAHTNKIWALGVLVLFKQFPFLNLNYYGEDESIIHQITNPLMVQALAGNGVLVPIEVFKKIGFYDYKWCPQYHGDTEFTYRATKNGIKCLVESTAVVYNNNFDPDPKYGFWEELFSKKSGHFWRPFFLFYIKYVPLKYKPFLFKQFTWIPKRILKEIHKRLM